MNPKIFCAHPNYPLSVRQPFSKIELIYIPNVRSLLKYVHTSSRKRRPREKKGPLLPTQVRRANVDKYAVHSCKSCFLIRTGSFVESTGPSRVGAASRSPSSWGPNSAKANLFSASRNLPTNARPNSPAPHDYSRRANVNGVTLQWYSFVQAMGTRHSFGSRGFLLLGIFFAGAAHADGERDNCENLGFFFVYIVIFSEKVECLFTLK